MKFMKYGNLYELCFMNIWNLLGLVNSLFHESFLLWNLFYEISIFIWYLYLIEKSDFGLEFPTNLKDFYRKEDFSKSCLFHEKTQFIGLVNLVSWNSLKLASFMNKVSWTCETIQVHEIHYFMKLFHDNFRDFRTLVVIPSLYD